MSKIDFKKDDFNETLDFVDNQFDLVSCCFAIYYAEDIPHTIREMHRVLKPGGMLFTTGPMPENKQTFYDVIREATGKVIPPMPGSSRYSTQILDSIRDELRKCDYLPILFDFEKPASKDLTETISTLAHMARFIIADITEPRSIPHELATIVPTLSVPVQPLLLDGSSGEYAMFKTLKKYDWVLSVHHYKSLDDLLESFEVKVINAGEQKAKELIARKQ